MKTLIELKNYLDRSERTFNDARYLLELLGELKLREILIEDYKDYYQSCVFNLLRYETLFNIFTLSKDSIVKALSQLSEYNDLSVASDILNDLLNFYLNVNSSDELFLNGIFKGLKSTDNCAFFFDVHIDGYLHISRWSDSLFSKDGLLLHSNNLNSYFEQIIDNFKKSFTYFESIFDKSLSLSDSERLKNELAKLNLNIQAND